MVLICINYLIQRDAETSRRTSITTRIPTRSDSHCLSNSFDFLSWCNCAIRSTKRATIYGNSVMMMRSFPVFILRFVRVHEPVIRSASRFLVRTTNSRFHSKTSPPVGKSGPGRVINSVVTINMKSRDDFRLSKNVYAIPTAIPVAPFTNKFGIRW